MPNWCENTLTVSSDIPGAVYAFNQSCLGRPANWGLQDYEISKLSTIEEREEAKRADQEAYDALPLKFCFNALVPVPQEIIAKGYSVQDASFGSEDDGYNWCIKHWGVKWDIYNSEFFGENDPVTPEDTEYIYDFCTAWGPPIEWVQEASRLSPDVTITIEYVEPGAFFAGKYVYKAGEIIEENDYEGEKLNTIMKELGYLTDWRDCFEEVTKAKAQEIFHDGKEVYGIDEDDEPCKLEIEEDLNDFEIFAIPN